MRSALQPKQHSETLAHIGDDVGWSLVPREWRSNTYVVSETLLLYHLFMTSGELKRWLADRGDLGTGLVNAIKKQLGLK